MPLVVTKAGYLVSSNQTRLFAAQVMSPPGQDSIMAWVTVSYYTSMMLFGYLCLLWAVGG